MSIKYYHEIIQGSDEWYQARLGIVTASEVNNLVTPTGKLASGKKVENFSCEIASQRHNMQIEDSYQSFDMMKGSFNESHARDAYNDNFEDVSECGFIVRDFGEFKIGGSPDGLIGDDGILEIKCRMPKFHVSVIATDCVPSEFSNQIQAMLMITGRKWLDFVHYSSGMSLFVKRVYPDEKRMDVIKSAVAKFEPMVVEMLNTYKAASETMVQTERVEFMLDDVITESKGE